MKTLTALLIILMAIGTIQAEENKVLQAVQTRMVQASKLHQEGDKNKAKQLVDESIEIMMTSIRNGKGQAWMREGLEIAMKVNKVPEIEIQSVMKQVDSYMGTVRPLSLREKLNSLTDTSAVKELARDRRRAALGGMFLGQKNGAVGYHPIISILPQGNSMTAGIVVSPDRRYVRVGISAVDTSIGAVRTFNFSTGEAQSFNKK